VPAEEIFGHNNQYFIPFGIKIPIYSINIWKETNYRFYPCDPWDNKPILCNRRFSIA